MDIELARRRLAVRQEVSACRACSLSEHARPVLFSGPTPARIVIVGEAPSVMEVRRGQPFVGPAGLLMRTLLRESGIPLADVVMVNAVACCSYGTPGREHVEACNGNLRAQIDLAGTPYVVAAGRTALVSLFPDADSVGRLHGAVLRLKDWLVMPVFHPSYILRNKSTWQRRQVVDSLKIMDALADRRLDPDWLAGPSCAVCDKNATVWDERMMPYCAKHEKLIGERAKRTKRQLKAKWKAAQGTLFDPKGLTS